MSRAVKINLALGTCGLLSLPKSKVQRHKDPRPHPFCGLEGLLQGLCSESLSPCGYRLCVCSLMTLALGSRPDEGCCTVRGSPCTACNHHLAPKLSPKSLRSDSRILEGNLALLGMRFRHAKPFISGTLDTAGALGLHGIANVQH